MKIDGLKAGRELDALVAKLVMGNKSNLPGYSTDIVAAMEILERLTSPKTLYLFRTGNTRVKWYCGCLEMDDYAMKVSLEEGEWGEGRTGVFAETAPLAICLAALKVITAH